MIYLDNCATTKIRPEVLDVLVDSFENGFANPSSLHNFGMRVEEEVENARNIIARFLNVSADEIFFTSGGTESDNTFINGAVKYNKNSGKKIITTKQEHPAVLEVFKKYELSGYDVVYLNSDEYGIVNLDELENEMDENVILVSIMHANNEIGSINDIKKASQIIKSKNKNALFHVDGVQAFGKLKVDLNDLGVDGYSISGHKIHAPKGIGVLYVKKGLKMAPFILGGGQEKGFRSGTENTQGILALGKAVEILEKNFDEEHERISALREMIVNGICENFTDYVINTPLDKSVKNVLNVSFLHTRGEVILHYLERDEIYISTQSACSSNHKTLSNLEKAGKSKEISDSSIRICLSYENTMEDIAFFLGKLKFAVEDIRKVTKRKR